LRLEQLLLVRFAVCVMTKHLAQLLYVVHRGVPLVEAVLRTLSMAEARRWRATKSTSGAGVCPEPVIQPALRGRRRRAMLKVSTNTPSRTA
jgi:hypothetical protein